MDGRVTPYALSTILQIAGVYEVPVLTLMILMS